MASEATSVKRLGSGSLSIFGLLRWRTEIQHPLRAPSFPALLGGAVHTLLGAASSLAPAERVSTRARTRFTCRSGPVPLQAVRLGRNPEQRIEGDPGRPPN